MNTPAPHRLAEVPLFAGLPPAALEELARGSRPRGREAAQLATDAVEHRPPAKAAGA